ncbi:MAG: hypothetical protein EA402_01930 [Planctomycetota bacterium]|nr:MAG: hypothetical protein EA402_01930 [Planctomycetota bacterium]
MALFSWGRKKDNDQLPVEPDFTEIQPEEVVDEAWQRLEVAIGGHPLFRLMTFDGLYWIDPFNGELVSAPFDLEDTIREHFRSHEHWRGGRTRSPIQLYAQRWLLWLEEDQGRDPRFTLFTEEGRWFNPCERRASESISSEMAARSGHFLRRIAQELAQNPENSPHTMPKLEALEVDLGLREPPPEEVVETGHGSGIRQTQAGIMADAHKAPVPMAEPGTAPVAVPPGHVAYVVAQGGTMPVVPSAGGAVPAAGQGVQPGMAPVQPAAGPGTGIGTLPALALPHSGRAQALVAEAVRDIQSAHALSEQALEQQLIAHSPQHRIPESSEALLQALYDLRDVLAVEAASRGGPSNQEIYNCLISMRDDIDTGELRRKQEASGGVGSSVPVVSSSQLSQEAIESLVSSLRSISLVADKIATGAHQGPGKALEPREGDESGLDDDDYSFDELPGDEDEEQSPGGNVDDDEWAEDMQKAGAVQGHLLGGIPALKDIDLAIEYRPYTSIGGDFYQVVKLGDERFFFMVGDVSGHGVQAALIVSSIVNSLKIILRRAAELSLEDIICELNDYMRECLPSGKFFTAFSGIIDTSGETVDLECVCSGHHPTICLNAHQAEPIREIGKHGMGIGIVRSETFRKQMHSEHYTLVPGDVLAIYTDGITETMDENGEELGEMLVRCSFFAHMNLDPHLQIQAVLGDIAEESDGVVNDDLTVMVIRILGNDED